MQFINKAVASLISSLFSLLVIGMLVVFAIYFHYSPELPTQANLHQIELQIPLRIYSRDKQLIAEYGTKRRRPVSLQETPEQLRQAFIAIEDARYYSHSGIDIKGIIRAVYNLFITGNVSQGASTITMQLARNAFLSRDKTLERKLKEVLLAIKIEKTLTKDEILELYLNKIYLGNRAYGIAAAAETYYGKENLWDLTLAQSAMIAGLPKAPSRYNPIVNPKRAMVRRDYILKRMLELGYINEGEYYTAIAEPNTAKVHKPEIEVKAPYIAEMVRSFIVEKHRDKAYTQGYHVYTTLDSDIQQHTIHALRKTLIDYDIRHGYRGPEDKIDLNNLALGEQLDKLAGYPQIADMEAALVLSSDAKQAQLLRANEEYIQLDLAAVKWARPYINVDRRGSRPKKVSDVVKPGHIVRIRHINNQASTEKAQEPTDHWQLTQIPKVGGALLVMDPHDGAIRSLMGGFDFNQSKFNRATQARRQPGSSFKPVIYSAALHKKQMTPSSIVNDAPITVSIPGQKDWKPKNYSGKYIGPTTLSEALARSRNLVSIRLLRTTGINYSIDYATRFGFNRQHLPPNLTLALGTGLTTPLQMATAYATFANQGFKIKPYFIERIEDNAGLTIYQAGEDIKRACHNVEDPYCSMTPSGLNNQQNAVLSSDDITHSDQAESSVLQTSLAQGTASSAKRIIDSHTHHHIVKMMQNVTKTGTASRIQRVLKRSDIAGKTGTTNDQRDSWFCGFTPKYVAVAWAGFDDMSPLGEKETSTKVAVPMWIELMKPILKDTPEKDWPELPKLIQADADIGDEKARENAAGRQAEQMAESDSEDESDQVATEDKQGFEYENIQATATETEPYYQNTQTGPENAELSLVEALFLDSVPPASNHTHRQAPQAPAPRVQQPAQPATEAVEIPEQIF